MMNQGVIERMNPIFQMMRTDTHYLEESLKYFREELKRLRDVSNRLHFEYVFVLIPDVHQVNPRRFELKRAHYGLNARVLEPKRVSREISASLRQFGIPHMDISECFSGAVYPDRLYFIQDNHFTAEGHDTAATCLLSSGLMAMITR